MAELNEKVAEMESGNQRLREQMRKMEGELKEREEEVASLRV